MKPRTSGKLLSRKHPMGIGSYPGMAQVVEDPPSQTSSNNIFTSEEEALLQDEPFLKAKTVSQNALQCEDSSQNDTKVNQLL